MDGACIVGRKPRVQESKKRCISHGPLRSAEPKGAVRSRRCIARESNAVQADARADRCGAVRRRACSTHIRFRGAPRDLFTSFSFSFFLLLASLYVRTRKAAGNRALIPLPRGADYVDIKYHQVHSASRFCSENDDTSYRPLPPMLRRPIKSPLGKIVLSFRGVYTARHHAGAPHYHIISSSRANYRARRMRRYTYCAYRVVPLGHSECIFLTYSLFLGTSRRLKH